MKKICDPLFMICCLLMLSACGGGKQGQLVFKDSIGGESRSLLEKEKEKETIERKRAEFALEKVRVWKEINTDAKTSFEDVRDIFQNKCMNCHDSSFKLPLYGKILGKINPVKKHQVEGLKSFDFVSGFPFSALGSPPQISLLKSIKNSFVTRSMPIKSFTAIYAKKKVNEDDEKRILAWINPIIENFEEYEVKYNSPDNLEARAQKILEMKCFRCHANGNARGGFGGMENTEGLLRGKYVSNGNPEGSELFTSIRDGQMPPNKQDIVSIEDQYTLRDWLEKVGKKIK